MIGNIVKIITNQTALEEVSGGINPKVIFGAVGTLTPNGGGCIGNVTTAVSFGLDVAAGYVTSPLGGALLGATGITGTVGSSVANAVCSNNTPTASSSPPDYSLSNANGMCYANPTAASNAIFGGNSIGGSGTSSNGAGGSGGGNKQTMTVDQI